MFHTKLTLLYIKVNICMEKNWFASHKQYLFGRLFYRNAKTLFYFVRIKTTHKLSKVAAAKNVFIHCVYLIDTTCFDEYCFLFHVITRRHYFYKSLSLLWHFLNRHIVAFFETSVWKEIRILCYLHNNSAVLIPNFPKKLYYTLLDKLS